MMPSGIVDDEGKFAGSVKVGPKGQIVIPKEVRDMFGIKPGDTLLLLADKERGIAVHEYEVFKKVMDPKHLEHIRASMKEEN